ncbi:MAG TPA: hypothetical protein VFT13_02385, partial [Candidatus Krumholzibacteria bacterium]|nr:hypothetical protein [Candidatus Krumholzibacteria bacterium]
QIVRYFLMSVDVPDGVASTTLLGAILEFALDVDVRADTVAVVDQDTSYAVIHWSPVPLVEVCALNSATGSALDSLRWNRDMSFPVPVALGTDKVVRIDITRLVNHLINNPEENHGLVIGSLSGRRNGVFSLRQRFGPGVLARIRYVY